MNTYYLKSNCHTHFVKIDENNICSIDLASNFKSIKESMFSLESIDDYSAEELANFTAHLEPCQKADSEAFAIMDRLEKLFLLAKVHANGRNEQRS
jgi:superfamily II helicase